LRKSGIVYAYSSKTENRKTVLSQDGVYFVTFDPIDGTKLITANLAISSIFGIWRATDLDGMTGRALEGAALSIYSSRSSILLYNSHTKKVEELTLIKMGRKPKSWVVTKPSSEIHEYAHNFSPEGIKAAYEKKGYLKCFQKYVVEGYSIRYSSSMAMDCYQMFIKKGGVYISVETVAHGAILRLLYECIPIGWLIEAAGGVATNGKEPILDIKI
jgi:fructose-1,6-bisphosphatase